MRRLSRSQYAKVLPYVMAYSILPLGLAAAKWNWSLETVLIAWASLLPLCLVLCLAFNRLPGFPDPLRQTVKRRVAACNALSQYDAKTLAFRALGNEQLFRTSEWEHAPLLDPRIPPICRALFAAFKRVLIVETDDVLDSTQTAQFDDDYLSIGHGPEGDIIAVNRHNDQVRFIRPDGVWDKETWTSVFHFIAYFDASSR
jgi:hypothetical protein